jgi:hypothetical protein
MRSNAGHVGGYLALAPGGRRAVLSEMRHTCRRPLAGFAESMGHGMPAHSRDGAAQAARATHKRHISLHVMRADVHDAHHSQLAGLDLGEGCIRYRSPAAAHFTIARPMAYRPSRRAAVRSAERRPPLPTHAQPSAA